MPVAATKTQLIVQLQQVRYSQGLPTSHQAGGDLLVTFRSLGLEVDTMTVKIHHIEGVESAISFDVTGPHQVGLVHIVKAQNLSEIRILDPFRRIRGFF